MKAVVIERDKYGKGKHQYNAKLLDLSKTYGFRIKLCRPFRAKTKGKVERFNSYLKGNFYRPLVITLSDAKLEITHHVLNNSITPWLIEANGRLHGTTGKVPSEVFIEETPHLIKHGLVTRISNPKTQKPIMVPITVVQTTNLNKYDELLIGDVL
jgi:hypothetical protein